MERHRARGFAGQGATGYFPVYCRSTRVYGLDR